jgi:regulatory protein
MPGKTYERALNMLSARARSAKGLTKRLLEKGEPPDEVEATIARLLANGLLDDARYAEARARAAITGKSRSKRRLSLELAEKGVARDVADAAIQRAFAEEGLDEAAVAERAARKKMRSLARLAPEAQRQKLYAFLARQGHPAEIVRRVMRSVLEARPPDEADE